LVQDGSSGFKGWLSFVSAFDKSYVVTCGMDEEWLEYTFNFQVHAVGGLTDAEGDAFR
jgi:hypothetical protein